jgi:Zn-dependent alcohol dehydrogenase
LQTAAFAEYVVVEESQVVRIPEEMPLDRASLLACGVVTGFGAVVNTARISSGSKVVIIGTGGVGLNSVQGAYLSGAQVIIAVDLVNSKLEAAKVFGATHTVNPLEADVAKVVRSLTQGRGADYVFVTVGSGTAIEQGLELMRPAGTLVMVGLPASGLKVEIEAVAVADKSQRILGSKMGATRISIDVPMLVELYQQGRLKLDELITTRYPLAEINQAIAAVKQGNAVRNVIVF